MNKDRRKAIGEVITAMEQGEGNPMRTTCADCGATTGRLDIYWGSAGPRVLCDPCALPAPEPEPAYVGGWDDEDLAQRRMAFGVAAD